MTEPDFAELSLIVSSMREAVVLLNADGRLGFLNRVAEELTGWRLEQARGRPWRDVLAEVDLGQGTLPQDPQVRPRSGTHRLRGRGGETRRVRVTGVVHSEEQGPCCVYFAEVVPGESALERSEARYRQLLDLAQEGIWVIDAEGRTTFVNPAMADMLGYAPAEMEGRHLFDFMDDEARAQCEQNLARRRSGVKELHDFRLRHRDGRDVWTAMAVAPITGAGGAFVGAIAGVIDLSERVRAEEQRRALELKLLQAQKLEGMALLAGGVAHDFNNVLQGILGYTEVALGRLHQGAAAAAPLLQGIQQSARHGAGLCEQMLLYAGRGTHALEVLDLEGLVANLRPLLEASVPRKVALRYELQGAALRVEADPVQLRQVILNLVINAAEAIGEGAGTVTLAAGSRELSGDPGLHPPLEPGPVGPGVVLEVTDTGAGMTPEVQEKMFDPFFSTKFTGRGLGLAAVLGIVRGHGGALQVESAPEEGTTIRLLLPASDGVPAASPQAEVQPALPARATVLVVDDEDRVRRSLRLLLEDAGYGVVEAEDGEVCLRRLGEGVRVDAVLLDLTMPKKDGAETLAELRRLRPELPVALTSGYSEQEVGARGDGSAAFLKKPFTRDELLRTLARLLGE